MLIKMLSTSTGSETGDHEGVRLFEEGYEYDVHVDLARQFVDLERAVYSDAPKSLEVPENKDLGDAPDDKKKEAEPEPPTPSIEEAPSLPVPSGNAMDASLDDLFPTPIAPISLTEGDPDNDS